MANRVALIFFLLAPATTISEIIKSVPMPANSYEGTSEKFKPIPAPEGARAKSEWFACEPSEKWGTWIGNGTAEFHLDTLREGGEEFKACRIRINKNTRDFTRGCFTKLIADAPLGYVYRVYVEYKCPGATGGKPIDLRPLFVTEGGSTYATRSLEASEDWTVYTSPWLAPPGPGAKLDVEVLFKHLNDGRQHLDCWFRPFKIERVPVTLRSPRNGEATRQQSPVFSWEVARADLLQVSTSPEFPEDKTWSATRNQMPVAAYRFEHAFKKGRWFWRIGFKTGEEELFWVGPSVFYIAAPLPGQWTFDFGPADSPVDPEAMGVTPASISTESRAFSLTGARRLRAYAEPDSLYRAFEFEDDKSTWRGDNGTYFRNRRLTLNSPLTRDFIEGEGRSVFRAAVPDGSYRVLIIAGHPNDQAQGDRRIYEFEARTNLDKARFRKTWPFAILDIHSLKARAEQGYLEIELVPTAGDDRWVINGILILSEEQARTAVGKGLIQRWYELVYTAPPDILDGIQASWPSDYARRQPTPPEPFLTELDRGFILYSKTTKHALHPLDVPKDEERIDALRELGSRTEPVQMTFALWAIRDLYGLSLSVSDLKDSNDNIIPKEAVRIRRVYARTNAAYYESIRTWDGVLLPAGNLDLDEHRTQQYLLTVNVPQDAAAGQYQGQVRIADEHGALYNLPLKLQVTSFTLEPADKFFVLFVSDRWEEYSGDSDAVLDLLRMGKRAAWSSLAAHGSTTIEFGGSIRSTMQDGTLVPDCDLIRSRIRDWRESGGAADFAYVDLGWSVSQSLLKAWAPEEYPKHQGKRIKETINLPPKYKEEFPTWIQAVDRCIRGEGITTVVYAIHDEPHHAQETQYVRDLGILIRKACPESDVYVNTMNGPYMKYLAAADELKGAPVVTVWWTYGGFSEAQKEELAARGVRFLGSIGGTGFERENQGFMAWRERRYGGIDWTFNNFYASAAMQSDGPTWSGDASQMIPTVPLTDRYRWELIQQGHYDMMYIRTLQKAIADALASGHPPERMEAAEVAQAFLDGTWSRLVPGTRDMGGENPIQARRKIIKSIARLVDLEKGR